MNPLPGLTLLVLGGKSFIFTSQGTEADTTKLRISFLMVLSLTS